MSERSVTQRPVLQSNAERSHCRSVQDVVEGPVPRRLHQNEAVWSNGARTKYPHHVLVVELLEHLCLRSKSNEMHAAALLVTAQLAHNQRLAAPPYVANLAKTTGAHGLADLDLAVWDLAGSLEDQRGDCALIDAVGHD